MSVDVPADFTSQLYVYRSEERSRSPPRLYEASDVKKRTAHCAPIIIKGSSSQPEGFVFDESSTNVKQDTEKTTSSKDKVLIG